MESWFDFWLPHPAQPQGSLGGTECLPRLQRCRFITPALLWGEPGSISPLPLPAEAWGRQLGLRHPWSLCRVSDLPGLP